MNTLRRQPHASVALATMLTLAATVPAAGQNGSRPPVRADTTVRASNQYAAGALHRLMLGANYRDLWMMPMTVPFLDLAAFAGGLRPTRTGGGAQTKTLHFVTPDDQEFVFRPVHKALLMDLEGLEGTVVEAAMIDGLSASHPVAPLIPPAFLEAAGVLHAAPILVVMPDDEHLGEFRKEFAGMLGMIEESPDVPDDAPGFAGALKIIDSENLLKRLNEDPAERIDAPALLRARLIDLLLNDNDRHPDQWKWARMASEDGSPWVPIPRDRDKVLVSYQGLLLRVARLAKPELVTFAATYPKVSGLFQNASEMDRRLLGGLDKAVWDSIATNLSRAITDSVIDAAFRNLPAPYQTSVPALTAKIRSRRDLLPVTADRYYRTLFRVQDVHATDAAEKATIEHFSDGAVEIRLQSGAHPPHLVRRFDPAITREIRVYLHEGADSAAVTGSTGARIKVRVIGGNGINVLVGYGPGGTPGPRTRFYDAGLVDAVRYPADSFKSHKAFNRRPLLPAYGHLLASQRDLGKSTRPTLGFRSGRDLGFVPQVGIVRTQYAFRTIPYRSRMALEVGYSTSIHGLEVAVETDHRFEESAIHVLTESGVSQLEVGRFLGFGNDVPDRDNASHDVSQTQWTLYPALAYAIGPVSDISLGPIIRYTLTDSVPGQQLSTERPYGYSRFGQAGLQLRFVYDSRRSLVAADRFADGGKEKKGPWQSGFIAEVTSSAYPAMWDANGAYASVAAVTIAHIAIPILTTPLLALRGGVERLWGDVPYFDAAFLGGSHSLRTASRQRFAGDAVVHGTAELRLPIASFPFILPINVGALGFVEAGRVFVQGESPGGWHTGVAAGLWLGVFGPGTSITLMASSQRERRWLVGFGFDY
ncbi:MAG TPA: hypothetical protein VF981_00810 [Gemmatimonadaceae bacterium]